MSTVTEPKFEVMSRSGAQVGWRSPRLPYSWVGPLAVFGDLLVIVAISVVSGIAYHRIVLHIDGDIDTFVAIGFAAFAYFVSVSGYRGNYAVDRLSLFRRQASEVSLVWLIVFLLFVGIAFLLKIGPQFSRGATLTFFGFGWSAMILWRWWIARRIQAARANGTFAEIKVLLLADAQQLKSGNHIAELQRYGYRAAHVLQLPADRSKWNDLIEQVARISREDPKLEGMFLIMPWQQSDRIDRVVDELRVVPLPLRLLPDAHVKQFLQKPVFQVDTLWSAELQRRPLKFEERLAKRVMDVVLAAAGLVLLLPLLAVVALLIKLDSRGPVFFRQVRNGFNNRPFRIFKFRTLHTCEDGPVIKQVTRGDPRMTRLGRLLRRTSIDELPQLFNVLRGDMSLVGPRPHAAAHNSEYERLIANYAFRHHVKPGLSGWAQVNGLRGETSSMDLMERRVELDRWYINNWSLWLDLKIITKTLVVICTAEAAH